MRIALLGDIHANLPALEAVRAHAHAQRVEAVWHVGDAVGYGAWPGEVVDLLQAAGILGIQGNYDQTILRWKADPDAWMSAKEPEKRLTARWTHAQLSREQRDYLADLPREIRLQSVGKTVLITHGSPVSPTEHLTLDTPEERLQALAETAGADIVLCGHSHVPFVRQVGKTWFVNPGSVGRQDDGDPRASYCVLDFRPLRLPLRVQHHRVPYDTERAAQAVRAALLPEALVRMPLCARALAVVIGELEHESAQALEHFPHDGADATLTAVLAVAWRLSVDIGHARQVARLSLRLFDLLQPLHALETPQRRLLLYAALLHDIGLLDGAQRHHKTALAAILRTPLLPLEAQERQLIGLIARYHRKALPAPDHPGYGDLTPGEQEIVRMLAALLRVADGLDRTHGALVSDLSVDLESKRIRLWCAATAPILEEVRVAMEKGRLMERVFQRKLDVEWFLK